MEQFVNWIIEYGYYWVVQYGYIGIFILLLLGVFGLPFPDEILLAFAGYLIFKGDLQFIPTLASACVGAMCGISLSYGLGHSAGIYLIEKYGERINLTQAKMDNVHHWYERMGRWILLLGYFFPGFRHLTALVAGSSNLQFPVFAVFAYPGALLWTGTYIFLGYFVGEKWATVSGEIHDQLVIVGGVLIVLSLLYYLIWQRKQRKTSL
jgi:membrane protein DedA with SNARE-associated domain